MNNKELASKDLLAGKCQTLKLSDKLNSFNAEELDTEEGGRDLNNRNLLHNNTVLQRSSTVENVFLIDHLLEFIIAGCDRQTLLNCRLLSFRWAHYVTKALLKVVHISFVVKPRLHVHVQVQQSLNTLQLKEDSIIEAAVQNLIEVMNTSNDFPSNSFTFAYADKNRVNDFLNLHGHSVKRLKLIGSHYVDTLGEILLTQAPNLQHLSVARLIFRPEARKEAYSINYDFPKTEEQKNRILSLIFQGTTLGQEPILNNLLVFKCTYFIPNFIIPLILDMCPNLIEVLLPTPHLHYLLKPTNRIHLLKKLNVWVEYIRKGSSLNLLANHHQGFLALKTIVLSGSISSNVVYNEQYLGEMDAMNQILKYSAASCQKLKVYGSFPCISIPKMVNVRHVSLRCCKYCGEPAYIFWGGLSLEQLFPNLQILDIISYYCENIHLRQFFGFNHPKLVTSVANVRVRCSNTTLDGHFIKRLKNLFPNASICTYE